MEVIELVLKIKEKEEVIDDVIELQPMSYSDGVKLLINGIEVFHFLDDGRLSTHGVWGLKEEDECKPRWKRD